MQGPGTYESELLDLLESLPRFEFDGEVWRVAFEGQEPLRPNVRGARWNPRDTSALYTSLSRECVRAEFEHIKSLQPTLPSQPAFLYRLAVRLAKVINLTSLRDIEHLGLQWETRDDSLAGQESYRHVGGAVAMLGLEGMLVPSLRDSTGHNLVIYTDNIPVVGFSQLSVASREQY